MTALTKNTFTFPNFGSMLHALNNGSAKKLEPRKVRMAYWCLANGTVCRTFVVIAPANTCTKFVWWNPRVPWSCA